MSRLGGRPYCSHVRQGQAQSFQCALFNMGVSFTIASSLIIRFHYQKLTCPPFSHSFSKAIHSWVSWSAHLTALVTPSAQEEPLPWCRAGNSWAFQCAKYESVFFNEFIITIFFKKRKAKGGGQTGLDFCPSTCPAWIGKLHTLYKPVWEDHPTSYFWHHLRVRWCRDALPCFTEEMVLEGERGRGGCIL